MREGGVDVFRSADAFLRLDEGCEVADVLDEAEHQLLAGPLPSEALCLERRVPAADGEGALHEVGELHGRSLCGELGTSVLVRTLLA